MEVCSLKWSVPFSCILSGPSQSGKTEIIRNILKYNHLLMEKKFDIIFYFYKTYQKTYDDIEKSGIKIFFLNSLITNEESLFNLIENYTDKNILLIFDDLQNEIEANKEFFSKIWTIYIHHKNISCIAIFHNLFTKNIRTISLNTHKIILTKNLRDLTQIKVLSQQAFPGKKNFLSNVFNSLSDKQYPYLLIDFSPSNSNSYIRVLTNLFPYEHPMVAYKESDCNPYEKLIIINEEYYKCLTSNDMCENSSSEKLTNNNSSSINNINLNNNNNNNNNNTNIDDEYEHERIKQGNLETKPFIQINEDKTNKDDNIEINENNDNDIKKEKDNKLSDTYNRKYSKIPTKNKFNVDKNVKKIKKNKIKNIDEIFKKKNTINKYDKDNDIEMKENEPMEESDGDNLNDDSMEYSKINRKRKGFKVINRKIHPYKSVKFNQGYKRKFESKIDFEKSKKIKNNYRKWKE